MNQEKVIAAVVIALCAAVAVRADMTPMPWGNPPDRGSLSFWGCAAPESLECPHLSICSVMVGFNTFPIGIIEGERAVARQHGESQPVCVLSDRQDSFALCLYALLGLGLCKSAPWAKRLSLDAIPAWYGQQGPCHVGHSLAISPDCPSLTLLCGLVQPGGEDSGPTPWRRGAVVSLWRTHQFSPSVVGPRGPPLHSC